MKRTRGRVTAFAVAALALTTLAGCSGEGGQASDSHQTPTLATSEDTPTSEGTSTPVATMSNGRIVNADAYFAQEHRVCRLCSRSLTAFDPASGTGLFAEMRDDAPTTKPPHLSRLTVEGPGGDVAELSCPEDFTCRVDPRPWIAAALGPQADEITLRRSDQSVRVLGYDGSVRRTLDLSAALHDDDVTPSRSEYVDKLAWSPDRSQLAIGTVQWARRGRVARVWLFDRDGGAAQLAYTATFPRRDGVTSWGTFLTRPQWSPDGTRIGVVEYHEFVKGGIVLPGWQGVVVLRLPTADQTGPATTKTLYEYRHPHWWVAQIAWSPDGTRVAATVKDGVLELSAEDGTVLDRHPRLKGTMIWLQKG